MAATVEFLGSLRHASGKEILSVKLGVEASIFDLITQITKKNPALRRILLDEYSDKPQPNSIILVNGKEISLLEGLDTKVIDGDEIVFVPIMHGG